MKNVIFISPNFPENYWHFCHELKENGMNVLGIGDCPYDDLRPELQESLQEYYKVDSLENYDEVYGAVGYFIWHYGRIDWLESKFDWPFTPTLGSSRSFSTLIGADLHPVLPGLHPGQV